MKKEGLTNLMMLEGSELEFVCDHGDKVSIEVLKEGDLELQVADVVILFIRCPLLRSDVITG